MAHEAAKPRSAEEVKARAAHEAAISAADKHIINSIRVLAADMVQKPNSGHPGMPMGMAPIAFQMWSKVMKFAPTKPNWANRDRFVLSNGHGCALLYSMLHLTGYALTLDDLKAFRVLGSKTPGHPEYGHTVGVEATTGPLGQGLSNAVGLAWAESHLAATYNKPNFPVFDHYTYVFCGDGCLQEGITSEASSLAGHLGLGKLIVIYDDNHVSIDGDTDLSFTEDVLKRYEAYGWHTQRVEDGDHDLNGMLAAVHAAQKATHKPSIIALRTTIGYGAKKEGTEGVHGSPLGDDLKTVKAKFGFDPAKTFAVDEKVYQALDRKAAGEKLAADWDALFAAYAKAYPKEAAEVSRRLGLGTADGQPQYPADWHKLLPAYKPTDKADSTRKLSQTVLNALAPTLTELVGGSADLTPSTFTDFKGSKDYQKNHPEGRYIRFGVREHAMMAIGNGIAAHGGCVPYTSTFLNFIEYGFPSVRLAALSHHHQFFVMTHDSIGLGEDGPTHQPIEAVALCRATPGLITMRPADGNEVSGAYRVALEQRHAPTVLCLTRQNLPQLPGTSIDATLRGGYAIWDSVALPAADAPADEKSKPQLILVATGSEVTVALEAAKKLATANNRVRVVSMPSTTLFDRQSVAYRRSVLVPGVPVVSVEALSVYGWDRYSHHQIGMTTYGASANLADVMKHFGFTADAVAQRVTAWLQTAAKEAAELGATIATPLPTHFASHTAKVTAH